MPYTRPYAGGFQDFPNTGTPINALSLNTIDLGVKAANDQIQSVTTAERTALTPTVGQMVWDSTLRQFLVYLNANGGNDWEPFGNVIVCTSTTRPLTPFEGQQIRETDTNKELVYSGTAWVQTNLWSTTSGVTGVNNIIVPPAVQVVRTTDLAAYASNTLISWTTTAAFDTDGMFSAAAPTYVTIQTPGLYLVNFVGQLTATATLTLALAQLTKNGVGNRFAINQTAVQATEVIFSVSAITNCVAGNQIGASLSLGGGSNYTVKGNASEVFTQSRMTVTKIGQTS